MPAGPGEKLLTTLFGDVHYFFSDPSSKPQHHRFDRGSYVYLFNSANENRGKLEIANRAGTPDQDAFSGMLDNASLRYSYKQPNLFTIVVDGAPVQGQDQWHLPSYNEKNEQKYLYKIHTLDIYLWTEKDAATFLAHLKSVLRSEKLDLRDLPTNLQKHAEHRDSMSPVVQQLEETAISPNFTSAPQRHKSTTFSHSKPGSPPAGSPQPAPMAYNPAAPAAPEPIAHREKTPPPPDAEGGNGLDSAARYDSYPQTQYSNVPNTFGGPSQYAPQQSFFTGPPQQQQMRHSSVSSFPGPPQGTPPSGSFAPPPPPPSFGPRPTQQYQNQHPTSPPPSQQSFGPHSGSSSFSGPPRAPSFGPNVASSIGMQGSQPPPPPPPAPQSYSPGQHAQQSAYGYSNYNYSASQQPQGYGQGGGYSGDIHSQAYQPTAEEGGQGRPASQRQNSESRQRMEDRMKQAEAGVGKYLKKLDKLW